MNTPLLRSLLEHPLVELTGWTLLHFVWQGILITLVVNFALALMRRGSPQSRYLLACAAMVTLMLAPVVTAGWLYSQHDLSQRHSIVSVDKMQLPGKLDYIKSKQPNANGDLPMTAIANQPVARVAADPMPTTTQLLRDSYPWISTKWLQAYLPWIVGGWCVGVAMLSIRLLAGLFRVWQWKQRGLKLTDEDFVRRINELAVRIGIRTRFQLLVSAQTAVPAVIGWFRPAIIVPASLITGMSPQELDSLIAHELAHIRRHDFLVNLLQTVIETLLFYHPAVWWISSVVRAERENCCDDVAAAIGGNRVVFAKALARMEELRCSAPGLAMSARNGSLLHRIRRILLVNESHSVNWWPAGLISMTSLFLGVGSLWMLVVTGNDNLSFSVAEQPSILAKKTTASPDLVVESLSPDEYPIHKPENVRIDSKTGQSCPVLADIKLSMEGNSSVAVDMKYANLFRYSLIPERVAGELKAIELGVIDFGKRPDRKTDDGLNELILNALLRQRPKSESDGEKSVQSAEVPQDVTVDELTGPAGANRIVPYADDVIWIPDHLGFYGMNATEQTKFRVVRIDRVDLGVGPPFGPVNALVIDDANSDFGVLGSNWAQIPRGKQGEGFVWAAVGGAYFMALPDSSPKNISNADQEKILASHTYNLARRESTGWVDVNGTGIPIDSGAEALGVCVHVSLMQTVVAVDRLTGKVLWHLDEGKLGPSWHKVSILELPDSSDHGKLVIVELEAHDGQLRRRFHIRTGEEIVPSNAASDESGPEIQILKRVDDQIQLAVIHSSPFGRSKTELIRRFQEVLMRSGSAEQAGWVTDQETLVSAENVQMLKPGPNETNFGLDAQEVIFNLPEGAGCRAEFVGEKITVTSNEDVTNVVVTNGRVKLFDANGVERADASPDGGAEQLVVEVRKVNGEGVLKLRTQRLKPDADYPHPPVQVKGNFATGAPIDEIQPPHGAVRFAFVDPEENEPARMKIQWNYELQRLIQEAEQESGRKWLDLLHDVSAFQTFNYQQIDDFPSLEQPSIVHSDHLDIFERAQSLGNWLDSAVRFDSKAYLQLAAELMSLDEEHRVEILRAMASAKLDAQTIAICRMLFEVRTGQEFRRPAMGEPHFVGSESKTEHWPLEPIALVNDVPLLVVSGYSFRGEGETAAGYLEYCLKNCDWTQRSYKGDKTKLEEAERTIRQPAFWQGGMDEDEWRELGGLIKQLRASFMIGIRQQPHLSIVAPVFLLDLEERIEPKNVVQELEQRGWSADTRVTFVVYNNASPEWIEQILKPLQAAGCRDFEFIRWQQSVEPVSIQELEHMSDPQNENRAQINLDDEWPALASGSGLKSRLTITTEKPSVGLPLMLKLELRNSGTQPLEVSLQNYAPFRVLRIEQTQPDGSSGSAPFIGMTPQTEGSDQTLAPNQVITVWENVDAASLFLLDEKAYRIFAAGGTEADTDSNRLEVNLQAGPIAPQQALLRELFKKLPEGWKLKTGFGAIYLSHSPTNLKADTTTIQLWFTDEKLPKDYELGKGNSRQNVELICHSDPGYLNIAAPPRAMDLWPEYVNDVKNAAANCFVDKSNVEAVSPITDDQSNSDESDERKPWRVFGRVADAKGLPIAGATVRVHTGIGSLRLNGEVKTNADGMYELRFGPGFLSENKQLVQAATISVELAGHFEKNLYRQGDRIAAMEKPEGDLGWGDKTLVDLFLPGDSKEIDFVMLPASKINGMVIGENGDRLDGVQVSLVGEEMPPSCSVVASTEADKGGRFELSGIPTGFKYQILVKPNKPKPPWLAWASPPIVFTAHDDDLTHFEYSVRDRPVDFGCHQLYLILNGTGINWKTALKSAAEKELELQWDGLSTDSVVRAGMTFLELGEKTK